MNTASPMKKYITYKNVSIHLEVEAETSIPLAAIEAGMGLPQCAIPEINVREILSCLKHINSLLK